MALTSLGLAGSYLLWLLLPAVGTLQYTVLGRNAWYFQLLTQGASGDQARLQARELGQELFPAANLSPSLRISARAWRTWDLTWIYFATFGGFIALTAWLPTYWPS